MEQPQQPEETQEPEESQQEPVEGQASTEEPSQQEESSESQEEASEEAPAQEAEAAEGDEPPPAAGAKPETAEEKHKRKGGYQRQIERLARQNEMLMEQNRAWAEQVQRNAPKPPEQEKSAIDQTTDFLKQVFKQQMAEEREAERQRSVLAEVQRKEQAFRATHEDYDDALDRFSRSGMSRDHIQAVLTSGEPPAIMYELASNPAELARISALSPLEAAREVGRLEAKLASGATPPKPKPAVRPPAPPSKVGGSSTSTRSLEDLPLSEYKRAIRSGRR